MSTNNPSSHWLSSPEAIKIVADFVEKLETAAALDDDVEGDRELASAPWPEDRALVLLRRLRALEDDVRKRS